MILEIATVVALSRQCAPSVAVEIIAAVLILCSLCAVLVALVGLKQIGPRMQITAVPAWLWYYRGDPLLQGPRQTQQRRNRR